MRVTDRFDSLTRLCCCCFCVGLRQSTGDKGLGLQSTHAEKVKECLKDPSKFAIVAAIVASVESASAPAAAAPTEAKKRRNMMTIWAFASLIREEVSTPGYMTDVGGTEDDDEDDGLLGRNSSRASSSAPTYGGETPIPSLLSTASSSSAPPPTKLQWRQSPVLLLRLVDRRAREREMELKKKKKKEEEEKVVAGRER
ncbi:hypothetical protein Cni_G03019 [Canna indica]|uniref:Uncharacterized protein n=1 Tax=Canna indica TaxID=4628 RepID=A0AAQ3JQX8_9LILI|nr:hypothetical protein Cni_G03019 [Canna indica]